MSDEKVSVVAQLEDVEEEAVDNGVEKELTFVEEFEHHDEQVERETTVALLEDGGIHLYQEVQGHPNSLTLGDDLFETLLEHR